MIDLYYAPTPNGWKISIMLEECEMDYKVIPVNLGKGDQFTPEFLKISPNNRMPVIVDHKNIIDGEPISIFESLRIFKVGMPSVVVFTDIANAWTNVFRGHETIASSGAEIRLSFNLLSEPLFIFSYGWAQETEIWLKDKPNKPEPYLQFSLVNPF